MIHYVFTVYDQKAHAYLPPFVLHHKDMATRIFSDCVNSNDHQFGRHPADYTLYCIGEYDDASGQLIARKHELLGQGIEFKIVSSPQSDLFEEPELKAVK